MSYFANLSSLPETFTAYPELARPLLDLGQAIMRSSTPLTPGERELIATYVSALNQCQFCQDSHVACAVRFGQPETANEIVAAVVADPDGADLPNPKLGPILRYVRKLTQSPSAIAQADIDAILAAGWDEKTIVYAAAVCGYFNLLNRLVEGLGIEANAELSQMAGQALFAGGYASVGPQTTKTTEM